ncbi:hypothetical protein C3L33_13810, partial [Rhododendron williamsianum]
MAVHSSSFLPHPRILPAKSGFPSLHFCRNRWTSTTNLTSTGTASAGISISGSRRNSAGGAWVRVSALDRSNSGSSNYVVPLDASSCITRPLAEILRDLNKRIPDNIIINNTNTTFIPWYHANRMLSFYAPGARFILLIFGFFFSGWCGEVRDVIFSDNGSVTVVYRVTIRGSDGEV